MNPERISLSLSNDCNLDCSYCYVKKDKKKMSRLSLHNLFAFIEKVHPKEIILAGGEPFMNKNALINLVKKFGHRLSITTNGTLIDEKMARFLMDNDVIITLSIDGDENVGTRDDGSGIAYPAKAIDLFKGYEHIVARMTFVPRQDFFLGFKHILGKGFKEINIRPAVGVPWSESAIRDALKQYAKVLVLAREAKIRVNILKADGDDCGAGKDQIFIDTDGKVYPCPFYLFFKGLDKEKYCIGDLDGFDSRGNSFECLKYNLKTGKKDHEIYESLKLLQTGLHKVSKLVNHKH